MSSQRNNSFTWGLLAVVPVFFIIGSYIWDAWTWGLMDDTGFLNLVGPWWQRVWTSHTGFVQWGTSRFTTVLHTQTFYPLFSNSPKAFYLFHMLWSVLTLFIWGANAAFVTKRKTPLFLVPVISFTYYFYYDTFAYLSITEPIGLFFTGIMVFFFLKGALSPLLDQTPLKGTWLGLGLFFLFFGIQTKELFLSVPLALSFVLFIAALLRRRWSASLLFVSLLAGVIGYAFFLKFFIQGQYTARYDIGNAAVIWQSFQTWMRHSLVFHVPWLILFLVALGVRWRQRRELFFAATQRWGALFGLLSYGIYLVLLLPWQVTDFYAIPLGVFFAFTMTILLTPWLDTIPKSVLRIIQAGALVFILLVCQQSFGKMRDYRNDTAYLVDWMVHNGQFRHDLQKGYKVATNAPEAGARLPYFYKKQTGEKIQPFQPLYRVKDIMQSKEVAYYLYNPRLGDQDLRRINQMWSVVFSSRSWTLFRRLFWMKN